MCVWNGCLGESRSIDIAEALHHWTLTGYAPRNHFPAPEPPRMAPPFPTEAGPSPRHARLPYSYAGRHAITGKGTDPAALPVMTLCLPLRITLYTNKIHKNFPIKGDLIKRA